jgi:UDP-N-acetylglucosamine--N-acetylmuramyl-(pentapeptide) pyrophosphoryl-undecaprenol N-acetylglucosamine transferase
MSAWMLGIPIFLQESDISPGLTSRQIAPKTLEVFTAFTKTEFFSKKKMILVGNPIRAELLSGSKESAAKTFSLKGGRAVIVILGGSLGAQRINDKILDVLPQLLASYEIIHQVGAQNIEQIKKEARIMAKTEPLAYYHPVGFADEKALADVYAAADIIISRAGGGSIFEIAASKKPSILIPLPEAAQNHQVKNAYAYAGTGAALVFEENNFTPHLFLEKISELLSDQKILASMSKAAADFARPKAAQIIAEYITHYLTS